MTLTLKPRSAALVLGGMTAVVVLAHLVVMFATYLTGREPREIFIAKMFFLDSERNVPTAFSAFLLLSAAALLVLITLLERQRRARVLHWAVLAGGFVLMAIDEAWSFHESLTPPVRGMLGNEGLGVYYYAWVIPALIFVAVAAVFFLGFLWRLPARTRAAFVVAGAIFVGGSVGVELVEGRFDEVYGDRNLTSALTATVQETMEMVGVVVFIWALLGYLADQHRGVQLRFERGDARVPRGVEDPAEPAARRRTAVGGRDLAPDPALAAAGDPALATAGDPASTGRHR